MRQGTILQLRFPGLLRASIALGLGLLVLALLAACDGDDDDGGGPVASPTAGAEGTRLPDDLQELGEGPVFWRTLDRFESLRAAEPYKIVLRVTNGYDEETLAVVAGPTEGGAEVEFEATRVEPEGEEAPGAFYTLILTLPEPGGWRLTVVAGEDESSVVVEAEAADAGTGY